MTNGRFHTPKCRGNLQKMEVLYTHPLRSPGPCYMQVPLNYYFLSSHKKIQKNGGSGNLASRTRLRPAGRLVTIGRRGSRWPAVTDHVCMGFPLLHHPTSFFLPLTSKILHMWSTLPHWLQHMPALPKFLQKTSNIHNFWSIGPKNTKVLLPWSLLRGPSP
jgi:hypothetical protein